MKKRSKPRSGATQAAGVSYDLAGMPESVRRALAAMTPAARESFLAEAYQKAKIEVDKEAEKSSDNMCYRDDIGEFARAVLGIDLAPYQEDILAHFLTERRVAVRGPHGLGKTTIAAIVILWAVATIRTDLKVVTTASAWRQLTLYLWPEVHKWAQNAKWELLGLKVRPGVELLSLNLKIADRSAFAVASDDYNSIEGAHATTLIAIFDEAKAIPDPIWDALEGAFSTGNAYALAISTPEEEMGRFYEIHARKVGLEDWWVRHVTLEEAVAAGRVSQKWADDRRRQWGEKSALFKNRVLGEFAGVGTDALIPFAWIEAANLRYAERLAERREATVPEGPGAEPQQAAAGDKESSCLGADIGRYGDDPSVIAEIEDRMLIRLEAFAQESTMQVTGRIRLAAREDKNKRIGVDVIGIGSGVVDRLLEEKFVNTMPINSAESTDMTDVSGELRFTDVRSAMWWSIRESLDPDGAYLLALPTEEQLPGVDLLVGDLLAPKWKPTSKGLIQVERKDDIRRRLRRSTDYGDALCFARWVERAGAEYSRRRRIQVLENFLFG